MPLSIIDSLFALFGRLSGRRVTRDDALRHEELPLQDMPQRDATAAHLAAVMAEAQSTDRWTSRARPAFLYVMYAMILWALPMGLVAAVSPATSRAITEGMTGYLSALPEPLYALFATGYLGYATLRQWGKAKGTDR